MIVCYEFLIQNNFDNDAFFQILVLPAISGQWGVSGLQRP